ncbi:MAG: sugar phosphate isomerase/epimerase [Clostridiales bacterium]|nr:sugar phosphate isomerase/epimerase [Clostridiales bacterium]
MEHKWKFKLGVGVDVDGQLEYDCPFDKVDAGFDYIEMPASFGGMPFNSDAKWAEMLAKLRTAKQPVLCTNDYIRHFGLTLCGPKHDEEQCKYWASKLFPRLNEAGVKYVGVFGSYFPDIEGFDRNKAYDQAIASCNVMADWAEKYGMIIALEPCDRANCLWNYYLDGLKFAKETGRRSIRVMADLNYFVSLNQKLEDVLADPDYLCGVHIQGNNAPGMPSWAGQPNVGNRMPVIRRFFEILKEMDYDKTVTCACAWASTTGKTPIDYEYETGYTLKYLQNVLDEIYSK